MAKLKQASRALPAADPFHAKSKRKLPDVGFTEGAHPKRQQHAHVMPQEVVAQPQSDSPESISFFFKKMLHGARVFCGDEIMEPVLGKHRFENTKNNPTQFLLQILSRSIGDALIKKLKKFPEDTKQKILQAVIADVKNAVTLDPVKPKPFQVKALFIGLKALALHRYAAALWQVGKKKDAERLAENAEVAYHVYVHPSAKIEPGVFFDHAFGIYIGENVKIGSGNYILHGTKIKNDAEIGKNVKIGCDATIAKGTQVGDNALIAAGASVMGNVDKDQTVVGFYDGTAQYKTALGKIVKPVQRRLLLKENSEINKANFVKLLTRELSYNPNIDNILYGLIDEHLSKKYLSQVRNPHSEGEQALAAVRVAQALWQKAEKRSGENRTTFINRALWLQGRNAEVYRVDVHPAARFGKNVLFPDQIEKGIVVGSTATVGNNVEFNDGVTLGMANFNDEGDRHPKIADNVYLGENSMVLGNIKVEEGATVYPNSTVVKPVPAGASVAGRPAQSVS